MWKALVRRHSPASPYSFSDLLKEQDRVREAGEPTLIFAEVAPTVTLGNRQDASAFEPLRAQGIDVVRGERGGLETWHGPGQWVGFVVCPIERLTGDARGVRKAVDAILGAVLRVVREFVPDARIEEGDRLGIWSERGKLVSIGIRVRDGWVTSGFALNAIPSPQSFSHIHPCGLSDSRPDFLFAGRVPEGEWGPVFEALPGLLQLSFGQACFPVS